MNQKIKDEAREKIAEDLYFDGEHFEEGTVAAATWRDMPDGMRKEYLARADQILSLSGEIDEVCPTCEGGGKLQMVADKQPINLTVPCNDCNGTGTIKKKWHIEIVEEE